MKWRKKSIKISISFNGPADLIALSAREFFIQIRRKKASEETRVSQSALSACCFCVQKIVFVFH